MVAIAHDGCPIIRLLRVSRTDKRYDARARLLPCKARGRGHRKWARLS